MEEGIWTFHLVSLDLAIWELDEFDILNMHMPTKFILTE